LDAWRNELRICALEECAEGFQPKREDQRFCCERHATKARVARHRKGKTQRSRYTPPTHIPLPEKPLQAVLTPLSRPTENPAPYFNPHGPTPGALQGDDYPLNYDANGYPELPACLDSRPKLPISEAA
jgi:hypothetical protein